MTDDTDKDGTTHLPEVARRMGSAATGVGLAAQVVGHCGAYVSSGGAEAVAALERLKRADDPLAPPEQ